jgi:MFS family permease
VFITIGIYTPLYSFSLFLPTIIQGLGFSNDKTTQLMTVPPYVAACICCIAAGWLADRHGQRGLYMIFFNCVAIFGFILLICSSHNGVKYAGTFFAAMGIYPNVPQGVAWNSNNIGGSTKRGVGIGTYLRYSTSTWIQLNFVI